MDTISASYTAFISHLEKLIQKKESVCIFFTSEDKRAGRIIMLQGDIIHVHYANKSGNDAIERLAGISQLKYRLQPNPPKTMNDASLPSTDVIVRNLAYAVDTTAGTSPSLGAESKLAILSCLTDVIGPMAEVICEEHFSQGGSVPSIIKAISAELSEDEGQEFYQLVSQKIR